MLEGKEFVGSNFTVKTTATTTTKTVPFVARESEIITEIPSYLCGLACDITREKQIRISKFTRCKVDLYKLSSFRRCPYTYADLDINDETSVLSQLAITILHTFHSKNRAKEDE